MDSEELMKKTAIVLAGAMLLAGCKKAHGDYIAVPRQVITDYNTVLTEAQDRAKAYQEQNERLIKKLYKHKKGTKKK